MKIHTKSRMVWGLAGFVLLAMSSALWAARVPVSSGLPINAGMAGSWADPSTPGQGIFLDVDPDAGTVFLAWFTFRETENQNEAVIGNDANRWFVALGEYAQGAEAVEMMLFETSGGVFDQPSEVTETETGSLILRFFDCESAQLEFSLDDGSASGIVELRRLTSGEICESISNN